MDPVSAVGIGLGLTSLVLQVFSGCIQGYQLYCDAEDLPAAFEHLRLLLQLEQARLLTWGENVGLFGERLDRPSRILRLDQNIILNTLLAIQNVFKESLKVSARYEKLLEVDRQIPLPQIGAGRSKALLSAALSKVKKTPQVPTRIRWAMVDQDKFEAIVKKLVHFNDAIEALLDRVSFDELRQMQLQSNLVMLQLTTKVEELKQISLAMHVKSPKAFEAPESLSRSSTLVGDAFEDNSVIARLASFKAQQTVLDTQTSPSQSAPISREHVQIQSTARTKSLALYQKQHVWIEWKTCEVEGRITPAWKALLERRISKLAALLCMQDKPAEFRAAPNCIGYFEDEGAFPLRYGLVYQIPRNAPATYPLSLRRLLREGSATSLTRRFALATALAEGIMYLHAVNWLHKSLASQNVVFMAKSGSATVDLRDPTLVGFGYARPDLEGEPTEEVPADAELQMYRHPNLLDDPLSGSKKSFDIYSLGIILVEIAYWKSIDEIMGIAIGQKGARSKMLRTRDRLLSADGAFIQAVEIQAGEEFAQVVHKCLAGGQEIGIDPGEDETQPHVGAAIQQTFFRDIVCRLKRLKV